MNPRLELWGKITMIEDPKIKYVTWRNGRPRFSPSATLRAAGFEGKDLRNAEGRWMTAGEALDWSRAVDRQIELDRRKAALSGKRRQAPKKEHAVDPARILPAYPVETLFDDWLNITRNPAMSDLAEKTLSLIHI